MEQEKQEKEKEPIDDGKWMSVGVDCCGLPEHEGDPVVTNPVVDVAVSFALNDHGSVTSVTVTADMTHPCGISAYQIRVSIINPPQMWRMYLPSENTFFYFACPDAGGENQQFSRTWDWNLPNRLPIDDISGWHVFAQCIAVSCCGTVESRADFKLAP